MLPLQQSRKLFAKQINLFLNNFPSVITSPLFNEMGVLLGNRIEWVQVLHKKITHIVTLSIEDNFLH